MAVVRAGDSTSSEQAPGGKSATNDPTAEIPPESRRAHRLELASDDITGEPIRDRITPLQIPPPPGVPNDLLHAGVQQAPAVARSRRNDDRSINEKSATRGHSSSGGVDSSVSNSDTKSRRNPTLSKYSAATLVVASVVAVVAVLAALRGRNERPRPEGARPSVGLDTVVHTARVSPSSSIANAKPPETPILAPADTAAAPVSSGDASTTRVTLELMPIDAKVFSHGREISGPPFEFDIVKGKRTAVEVKRPGYVTAKVVMDGTKPLVHFGMLREPARSRARATEAPH